MFPIIEVPDDAFSLSEQLGTKPKFWYGDEPNQILFKEGRPESGEDWAEKVICELGEILGLPHAHYDLAVWRGKRGVVSPTFVPDGGILVHGNELLAHADGKSPERIFYKARQHVLRRVLGIMRDRRIRLPLGWVGFEGVATPLEVFLGYLMLDAWVANQDRHNENWSLLVSPDRNVHLAPTYDHAAGLGRNETDESRRMRLTTGDFGRAMPNYVTKARSALYDSATSQRPLLTIDAFIQAARLKPRAASAWLNRLRAIDAQRSGEVLSLVPPSRISSDASDFAAKILELNRERLLAFGDKLP